LFSTLNKKHAHGHAGRAHIVQEKKGKKRKIKNLGTVTREGRIIIISTKKEKKSKNLGTATRGGRIIISIFG